MLAPHKTPVDALFAGEVGYLAAQIKSVLDARVGDTVTSKKNPATTALAGYEDVQPMVYCGLFPTDADAYQDLCVRRRRGWPPPASWGGGGRGCLGGGACGAPAALLLQPLRSSAPRPPNVPSKTKNKNPANAHVPARPPGARRWASCS